jgi:hypothetical protein
MGIQTTTTRLLADSTTTEVENTEGDLPIGDLKMKTGNGINNYAMPSIPVQGALTRLLSTKED